METKEKIEPSDIAVYPHLMIVMDEDGDIQLGSDKQIDLPSALFLVELARQKIVAMYFQQTLQQKKNKKSNIVVPNIVLK